MLMNGEVPTSAMNSAVDVKSARYPADRPKFVYRVGLQALASVGSCVMAEHM